MIAFTFDSLAGNPKSSKKRPIYSLRLHYVKFFVAHQKTMHLYLMNKSLTSFEFYRFERGWTLQELIAPSYVIFFDAGYSIRGTKDSLQQILSEITNIDVDVLKGVRPISSYCIAAKMSWAHRRKTTRTEDIAYCLLGIFGLNMPLLYGEGNKAFRRLQEQLIRTSVDMSIFAWTLPRSTGHDSLVIHQSHYDENLVSPPRHEIMLCGMLAESPSEFLHCKDFITGAREPPFELSLTNVGIKILTRLYARNFPDCSVGYVLDLNCVALKQDINLGVRLRKVGYGQYLREEPWSLQAAEQRMGQAPAEKILLTEIPHKHLYHECRYVPCHKVLGKARRSVLHLHHNRHIGLGHGWPADRFDDEDEVFFTSYTTSYDFGIIKLMVKMQLRHLDGSIWDRYHECQVYVIGWSKRSSSEAVFGILNARQYATVLNAIKQIAHGEGSNSDGFHYLLHENNIPRANTVRFNEPDFRKDILVTFKASIEQDRDLCSNAFWRLRLLTRTCDKNEKTPA